MTKCFHLDASFLARDFSKPAFSTQLARVFTLLECPKEPETGPSIEPFLTDVFVSVTVDVVAKTVGFAGKTYDAAANLLTFGVVGGKVGAVVTPKTPGMRTYRPAGVLPIISTFYDHSADELFVFSYHRVHGLARVAAKVTYATGQPIRNPNVPDLYSRSQSDSVVARFVSWHWLLETDAAYTPRIVEGSPTASGALLIDPDDVKVVYLKGQSADLKLSLARANGAYTASIDPAKFQVSGPASFVGQVLRVAEPGLVEIIPLCNDRVLTPFGTVCADNLLWSFRAVCAS